MEILRAMNENHYRQCLWTTHGLSLNLDKVKMSKFGGAFRVKYIPDLLKIIQRGKDPNHYEIVPKIPMTLEQYKDLLAKVVLE